MNEDSLFLAALEKPAAERQAFLDQACGGDRALRDRVQLLLDADAKVRGILDRDGPDGERTDAYESQSPLAGTIIAGRYKLLEQIGDGGMGTVWMAEQREPVKRLVAVKLIKAGMDSKAVLARFEAERQALALMDHPNIARVFDAGTDDTGRPYFVMELVKGLPLTEYCDARKLSVNERLDLFVQICSAVQHAHQKAVIHRDLKPTNVLVTEHDGKPVPKVIDFGLAKALNSSQMLTERTLHTAYGTVVGTPLYMAPEQVGINALDVDTRSDIYALGVILYELLTGTTPLEKAKFKEAAWEEVKRLIREEEPPRPSTRLSTSNALPSLAASRQVDPTQLRRLVRGELDWIVMKALEKDRTRRYETANGLAKDVQRYLNGDAVEACPPTLGYRLRKLYRRNKAAILTVGAFAALLVIGIAVSTMLAVQATHSRKVAELAQKDAHAKEQEARSALAREAKQRIRAENASADTKTALTTLSAVLEELNPYRHPGEDPPTVQEALIKACEQLETMKLSPTVRAGVRQVFGQMFLTLHVYNRAKEQLKLAYDDLASPEVKGPYDPDSLHALELYGKTLIEGRTSSKDLKLAEQVFQTVYDARKQTLGPGHPDTLKTLSKSLRDAFFYQMDFLKVRECQQKALAAALASPDLGENHEITAELRLGLTDMLARTPETQARDEARGLCESAIQTLSRLHGPNHLKTLWAKMQLLMVNDETVDPAEIARQAYNFMKLLRHGIDPAENDLLMRMYDRLAMHSLLAGKPELADEATTRLLELGILLYGKGHPLVRRSHGLRAWYLMQAGRYPEAETEAKITLHSPDFKPLDGLAGGWDDFPRSLGSAVLAKCILQKAKDKLTQDDFRHAEDYLLRKQDPVQNAPKGIGPLNRREKLLLAHGVRVWIELYEKWGKVPEAETKRKELEHLLK